MSAEAWVTLVLGIIAIIGQAVFVGTRLGKVTQSVDTMNESMKTLPCALRGERIAALETTVKNHETRIAHVEAKLET